MSNLLQQLEQPCDLESDCGAIEVIIKPREKELGGFKVRRVLPVIGRKMVGPWMFFDHTGTAYGVTSPVKTYASTLYVEAHLQAGQSLQLPDALERAVYVASGALNARDTAIPEHAMAVFTDRQGIVVEARRETRIAVIGGEQVGERFIEWNFVSSRKERIEQAKADWIAQRFPKVAGDEEEFIPLPGR